MSSHRVWIAFALSVALAASAHAEDPAPISVPEATDAPATAAPDSAEIPSETAAAPDSGEIPSETAAAPPSALRHGVLELSLGDAIRMGLENNLDVQVQRYAPLIADFDLTAAWGAYDPTLFGEFAYNDSKTPNSFALSGVNTTVNRSSEGFGGVAGQLPLLSTEFSAQFDGRRATTNSTIQTFSPEYTSGWSVDVTQPLMRDLIWNQPWTQVRTSKLAYRSSEEEFRRATMDEVQQIEDAYWNLMAAEESLRVANKSLEAASALLAQTDTQYEVGVVSRVEVTEARAGVSRREVERIRAENQYRNQQDVLIDLVLGPNLRADSSLEIRPTDRPDDFVPYEVDVERAVERAFELRPELAGAQRELERQELQRGFARNQVLPELDGFFRYGQSGLSGQQNPNFAVCQFVTPPPAGCPATPPTGLLDNGRFRRSTDDYEDFPQYRVGARFSIPFPNRTARANASRSELEFARARTSLLRLEQQIIIEVRQAARNLLASQEGITAARSAREAAEEQLRAEEIRLEYGESTPFEVLQREEDLVERERDEIEAFQAYRTSVTALDRAQGTLLRNRNIQIAEVAPLR